MRLAAVAIAVVLSGCVMPWVKDAPPVATTNGGTTPPTGSDGAPFVFGGVVVDALTLDPMPEVEVRVDLAYVRPCRQEGLLWTAWPDTTDAEGRFGPIQVSRPRSDDVAFFVRAIHEGYTEASMFVGPQEARGDIGNLTLTLHPDVALEGTAPPGTVLAFDAPGFPRLTVANATGNWSFPGAGVTPSQLVAGTRPPARFIVRAPETVDVLYGDGASWRLEGTVKDERGAPRPADVVAWNGTLLVGVARAGPTGDLVLDLPPEPAALRIVARTEDGRFEASRVLEVGGPPAVREAFILRALC